MNALTAFQVTEIADITTAAPREIDTLLSSLYADLDLANVKHMSALDGLHYAAKDERRGGWGRDRQEWKTTDSQAVERCRDLAVNDTSYIGISAKEALERLTEATTAVQAVVDRMEPLKAEFTRRGGWSRAFMVLANNGHLHSSMDCTTCFISTKFGWLPQASGLTEAEIVEGAGQDACTICYPTAPVNTLKRERARWLYHSTEEEAVLAREARAAEKAAKVEKAIKDGLTTDGKPLTYRWETRIDAKGKQWYESVEFKTERAASLRLVASLADLRSGYTYNVLPEDVRTDIVQRMADKHGKTVVEIQAEIDAKVEAKIKRDRG